MSKPADIGSKRLIGLNPDRWVEWVTELPDLQYIGLVKQILRWDMGVLEASPLYRELLEQARKTVLQQGIEQERRKTVENLMKLRFETIDPELEAIAPKLVALSTEEVISTIMQKSRQELLEQFGDRR
ncbi:hypothetical protein PMG71_01755 [Roseofilum sp. BLCC_M154]|uniref:DUF4351 domain-containing protein n=1 Tax=Roseofilum acuticapitatum BLCC-M154 TaxID=3022444 RepID=A0ABT7AMM4_9CYAN|nr:hypothetical protein [Roseofilum acuticapitatum]MDJ1168149.1 hypothetical protein [Roseofilum acuticapitatum BLCC-M154]